MKKFLSLSLMLLVGACSACLDCDKRDYWGNSYPKECWGDLTPVENRPDVRVHIVASTNPIFESAEAYMGLGRNRHVIGLTRLEFDANQDPVYHIYLADNMSASQTASNKKHELCHVIMGDWHD